MKRNYFWNFPLVFLSFQGMSSTYAVPANPDDAGATKTQLRWVFVILFLLFAEFLFVYVCLGFWSGPMFVLYSACFSPLMAALKWKCFLLPYWSCCYPFPLIFSDEIVTAAQHLYEMVSFYFDDLGKLLLVDVSFWFSLYRVSFSFVCLI